MGVTASLGSGLHGAWVVWVNLWRPWFRYVEGKIKMIQIPVTDVSTTTTTTISLRSGPVLFVVHIIYLKSSFSAQHCILILSHALGRVQASFRYLE